MSPADLNIIVCVDPSKCLFQQSHGRNGMQLFQALRQGVRERELGNRVQVTPCRCIFGCTYGPRVDVARRWAGDKVLYGTIQGEVTISRRGRVIFSEIPEDVLDLINDNLPGR